MGYVVDTEFQGCRNLKMPIDGYVFPQFKELFGEITIYTIVACIFVNENKCCTSGGLAITIWYILVKVHNKYICIIVQWQHYLGHHLKQKRCGYVCSPICHSCKGIHMESHDRWALTRFSLKRDEA